MTSFPRKHVSRSKRRNYQQKKTKTKNYSKSKRNNMAAKDKRPLLFLNFTDFVQVCGD